MFEINVWDLLASYPGDSKELEFDGEVINGFYDDIVFTKPLSFRIKIIALEDGVDVIFEHLDTEVAYEEQSYDIRLQNIERTFKEHYDPLLPDDIKFVGRNKSIDLKDVIREEILLATF